MTPATQPNRYLLDARGRDLLRGPPRWRSSRLWSFAGLASAALLVAPALRDPSSAFLAAAAVVGVSCMLVGGYFNAIALAGSAAALGEAQRASLAGDAARAVSRAQWVLARAPVHNAWLRMRALFTLGLCASARGDFAESADLFARALASMPTYYGWHYEQRAGSHILGHLALALFALGRRDEADAAARRATSILTEAPPTSLRVSARRSAQRVARAVDDLEPGRNPAAFLALVGALSLAWRGEFGPALGLVARDRAALGAALLGRERALLAHVEARCHESAGPLRAPGIAALGDADPGAEAWASRIAPAGR